MILNTMDALMASFREAFSPATDAFSRSHSGRMSSSFHVPSFNRLATSLEGKTATWFDFTSSLVLCTRLTKFWIHEI